MAENDDNRKSKHRPAPLELQTIVSSSNSMPKTPTPGPSSAGAVVCVGKSNSEREQKIGHRRVAEGGDVTYKKIQTSQIMGSIQLGMQLAIGGLASKPERDVLMHDFMTVEKVNFPSGGSNLTPAHQYSDFRFKVYAPIAFRYFRHLFGIQPVDFLKSLCTVPMRELSNPGASGSIFYVTDDDKFIIKTMMLKECEFLQKLLPGYYLNLNQNSPTLLPKFVGLFCYQCNSKNIRLVVMNNLLPSSITMHQKYDLKGSTFKRKASKQELQKPSPTLKDLDLLELHPEGIFLEPNECAAVLKTMQQDCRVLESFGIMDYSLLVGIHNFDAAAKQGAEAKVDGEDDTEGIVHVVNSARERSSYQHEPVSHRISLDMSLSEFESIDSDDDVFSRGIPAINAKGERLLLFVGIIDILQSYRLLKKLEHTFNTILHDGDTVSVHRPDFYAERFMDFMTKKVFTKIPQAAKILSPPKKTIGYKSGLSMEPADVQEENGNNDLIQDDYDYAEDEDENESVVNDDVAVDTSKPAVEEYKFEVIAGTEALHQTMTEIVEETSTLLDVSPSKMRLLLQHFKWDREKLLESYYENDQDKIFEDVHIKPVGGKTTVTIEHSGELNSIFEECILCLEKFKQTEMFGVGCEHKCCHNCWKNYMTSKIMSDGISHIACPKCNILADDTFVRKFIPDPAVLAKYHQFQANEYIEASRLMRWCTSPTGCNKAVRVEFIAARVTCSCGHSFCFQCGHAWHDPITCDLLKKWIKIKKCADDSETSKWIQTNTKDCPKCHVQIEKNGGCNHMTCRNQNCRYEFCWICMGDWRQHGQSGYNCNRYNAEIDQGQEQSRIELQRYLFYCDRYMNHMKSLRFEQKLYETIQAKMNYLQQSNMSWIEVQFLKKAVETLCQCRQTLMYTYGFAFYLEKTNQCIMFEDNQADFGYAIEALSGILDKDIPEDIGTFKISVQDKLIYCEARRQVLINHVYEGYSKDWWKFIN